MDLYGFVVFRLPDGSFDYRFGGQALPAGAVVMYAEGGGKAVQLHGYDRDNKEDTPILTALYRAAIAARHEMIAFS